MQMISGNIEFQLSPIKEKKYFCQNKWIKIKKNLTQNFLNLSPKKINDEINLSIYEGWNRSLIIKIFLKKRSLIDNDFIKKNFPKIVDREKMFISTFGTSTFQVRNKRNKFKRI